MTIRTRFAPSPTGLVHLGNMRIALFSALLAQQADGVFVLRIEDTDQARSRPEYVTALEQDLGWLGLTWHEGPGLAGEYGPYRQSERHELYEQYYQLLLHQGQAYYCFCSAEELAVQRKFQLSKGCAPRYNGTCRDLPAVKVNELFQQGHSATLRFKVPGNVTIAFNDLIKGPQQFCSNDLGDFIIRRSDNSAAFVFCNAVDDALMQITHVLRGEDHLTNTACQLMLLDALALQRPQYGHLALIVGDDGAPLSKRHGSYSIADLRQQGYLPAALLNYLLRLGHNCAQAGLLDYAGCSQEFNLAKLSHSAGRFDVSQLLYWQKLAVTHLSAAQLQAWLGPAICDEFTAPALLQFVQLLRNNLLFPHEAEEWVQIITAQELSFTQHDRAVLAHAGPEFFKLALQAVSDHGAVLAPMVAVLRAHTKLTGKNLYQPLRLALTGLTDGPELAPIVELLGAEMVSRRLTQVIGVIC